MPLDYTGVNTGLFYRVGRILKAINAYLAQATTAMPAELKNIIDPYELADIPLPIEGLASTYEGFKGQIVSIRQQLAAYADRALLDRDTTLVPLGVLTADLAAVLPALHQAMRNDSQTVDRSTVTVGAVTPHAQNRGNGTVLVTKVLDGFNPPVQGGLADLNYNGLDSELAVPAETMTLECIADSGRDGLQEGSEQFSWKGAIRNEDLSWQPEGSGEGPGVQVMNSSALVTDGTFENWGGTGDNTPSNWTLVGTTAAGTHVFREAGPTNVYRGTYSLRLTGDGTLADRGVTQAVPPTTM